MNLSTRVVWLATVNILLGLDGILESPHRTSSAAFTVAKTVMPIRAWGMMFLVFGVILVFMQSGFTKWKQDELRITVVIIGFVGCFFWAVCSFLNAIYYGTSFRGGILYGVIWSVHMMVAWWGE